MIPVLENKTTVGDLNPLDLALKSPAERVAWAWDTFGESAWVTTSFGAQSAAFLHLVTSVAPKIPVLFIDTGYHFPETLAFSRELADRLGLNMKIYRPLLVPEEIEAGHGKPWESGPEGLAQFHEIIRVEPLRRAFQELNPEIWLAGLRRSGSEHRQNQEVLSRQDSRWKLLPILEWSDREVGQYLTTHSLPNY